ncbi:MAG: phosphate/sulfate permease [Chlorobi bacterium]|nr:phosphate/sulfate permease [Chlorobiota bacterium]
MNFGFLDSTLGSGQFILLILCLLIALGFEVVNGFHDTANAVATVIYTRSLKPGVAVVWSGICNFLGVFVGGIAVALAIVHLLPIDLLVSNGASGGLAAVLALLVAAVLWNLGTWFYGLPASSSHTLIGAILGVGLANSLLPGHTLGSGVNWGKAEDVGLSLLLSPLVGFSVAALLLWLSKRFLRQPYLYEPTTDGAAPPKWIRSILILTCTGVSFAHGSNDGQKGVGLIMLVLIAILPAHFALNLEYSPEQMARTARAAAGIQVTLRQHVQNAPNGTMILPVQQRSPSATIPAAGSISDRLETIRERLANRTSLTALPDSLRWELRKSILEVDNLLAGLEKSGALQLSPDQARAMKQNRDDLRAITDYAPLWVLIAVAAALGLGTMIGWQRIVVTVGEKIGMSHLSYAQGAAAELVAMSTIGLSTLAGLPVSTTHVLASGIAGTMVANKTGLHSSTIRRIAMAWILTLPVSMLLAGGLFLLFRLFI